MILTAPTATAYWRCGRQAGRGHEAEGQHLDVVAEGRGVAEGARGYLIALPARERRPAREAKLRYKKRCRRTTGMTMQVKRIIADIATSDPASADSFYQDISV